MSEEDAVDQYMNGYCMFMAAALHHRYGFRIGLVAINHGDGERLCHAWVTKPDGKCLDIQGCQTLRQMTGFMGDCPEARYTLHEYTDLPHLERLAGTKLPADEPDVQLALSVAQQYLSKELA